MMSDSSGQQAGDRSIRTQQVWRAAGIIVAALKQEEEKGKKELEGRISANWSTRSLSTHVGVVGPAAGFTEVVQSDISQPTCGCLMTAASLGSYPGFLFSSIQLDNCFTSGFLLSRQLLFFLFAVSP